MENEVRLGDYTLGRRLGAGQYSKVYEAAKDGKKYALKCLKKIPDESRSKTYFDLVMNEAKTMSGLDHPNIVRLHEFSDKGTMEKSGGRKVPVLYLVFDLITGGELFDYVAIGGRFHEKLARHFFKQLISALSFLHSKGYVHRDIKAENVLLELDCSLKLADFGFSAPREGKDGSGMLKSYKGTEGYMAPEILAREEYSGEKVDLFAAGVLLFIMVAQHPPFRKASSQDALYKMFCVNNELYWKKVAVGKPQGAFSEDLKKLINSLLARDPKLRMSIEDMKKLKWFNEPDLSPTEVKNEIEKRKAKLTINWKAKAEEMMAKKALKKKAKVAVGGFAAHDAAETRAIEKAAKGLKVSAQKLFPFSEVIS